MVLVKGSLLVAPDGVAVTHAGIIYVADRSAAGGGFGKVFKIVGSTVTVIINRSDPWFSNATQQAIPNRASGKITR